MPGDQTKTDGRTQIIEEEASMDAVALLHRTQEAGLRIKPKGDRLLIRGPKRFEPMVKLLAEQKPIGTDNKGDEAMNLYRVTSTVKEFQGFKDVTITWVMESRSAGPVAPYADLIADYTALGDDRYLAEGVVDEMFTEKEAHAMLAWLNEHRVGVHAMKSETMPINGRTEDGALLAPFAAFPFGGLQGCLELRGDWNLPFKVMGDYDLRFYDRVDGTPAIIQKKEGSARTGAEPENQEPW
jgi:hypothetical protein